jgi:hypothetical protein
MTAIAANALNQLFDLHQPLDGDAPDVAAGAFPVGATMERFFG